MMDNKLPETWVETTLESIGKIISGGTPSTSIDAYWGGDVSWISPVDLSKYTDKYIHKGGKSITQLGLTKSSARLMPKGSVLFSSRAPIGYVAIAGKELCTNQGFKSIIQSSAIFNEYLYYFLKTAKKQADDLASGTTFKEISLANFSIIKVPLPPLAEQQRIVAKIEELFSELDKGVETLKTAKQQLKVYRQAVLKYAFEGKLTNTEVKEGELPEGWSVKKLGEIFKTTSGGTPSRKRSDFYGGEIPWVKSGELSKGLITKAEEYITDAALKSSSAKVFPAGSLLIALYGATIGKLSFLGIDAATNQAVCAIFPDDEVSLDYMFHYLTLSKRKLVESAVGGAQPNISQAILKDLEVNYPASKETQSLIVSEIESRLSVCDKIEESIEQGLQQAEALRQSILKKAFEGKLVPQDPNDEPASVLLERIKQERLSAIKSGASVKVSKRTSTNTRQPSTGRKAATGRRVKTSNITNSKKEINN